MPKTSLKAVAYDTIKEKIVTCAFPPGSFLSEERLTSELNISRTPIREALIRLQQEGLVEIKPKIGIMVTPVTLKDINMVFEVRMMFEPYILKTYGASIPDETLTHFLQIFKESSNSTLKHSHHYYELDTAFHMMIIEACPNTYIKNTYALTQTQSERFRFITGNTSGTRLETTFKEHTEIIKACLLKDWDKAVSKLILHLDGSKKATFDLALNSPINL